MEMGRRILKNIQGVERQNNKSTGTYFPKKKRKIQSRNGCIRICDWRSLIIRTRREMETYCFSIKNNVTG